MAFDEGLADRVRRALQGLDGLNEKRMFGGIAFLLHGNMACGILADRLIARIGPDAYEATLGEPGVSPFDVTGRPMRGWVTVDVNAVDDDDAVQAWIDRAIGFAMTLPPKVGGG